MLSALCFLSSVPPETGTLTVLVSASMENTPPFVACFWFFLRFFFRFWNLSLILHLNQQIRNPTKNNIVRVAGRITPNRNTYSIVETNGSKILFPLQTSNEAGWDDVRCSSEALKIDSFSKDGNVKELQNRNYATWSKLLFWSAMNSFTTQLNLKFPLSYLHEPRTPGGVHQEDIWKRDLTSFFSLRMFLFHCVPVRYGQERVKSPQSGSCPSQYV